MYKWIFIFLLFSINIRSQTLYRSDYVEIFDADWSGVWWDYPFSTTGYFTDFWVSSNTSAVIYGVTTTTNVYESDWYSFPNVAVDAAYDYEFSMRLASYRVSNPSAPAAGVDVNDYVTIQLSTDGGVTYVNELRITGNSNAYWDYNTSASYTKLANGTLTTIGPAGSGNRINSNPPDGYSVIKLKIPPGTTQIAIDIFARVNSDGEEWWMDNFELRRTLSTLPVELSSFTAVQSPKFNTVKWTTETEANSDYFNISKSTDGILYQSVGNVVASGTSYTKNKYELVDWQIDTGSTFYLLSQFDYNGNKKVYGPIEVNRELNSNKIVKTINMLGNSVEPDQSGIIINIYEDGHVEKKINY